MKTASIKEKLQTSLRNAVKFFESGMLVPNPEFAVYKTSIKEWSCELQRCLCNNQNSVNNQIPIVNIYPIEDLLRFLDMVMDIRLALALSPPKYVRGSNACLMPFDLTSSRTDIEAKGMKTQYKLHGITFANKCSTYQEGEIYGETSVQKDQINS